MSGLFEPIIRPRKDGRRAVKPGGVAVAAFLLASCEGTNESGFTADTYSPAPEDTTTECSPTLSASTAAKGESDELGIFVRFSFGYTNGECESSVASGEVRVHTLNLDAADPASVEANAYYSVPLNTNGLEGSLVILDTGNSAASVDIPLEEEADTYEVNLSVVDELGYLSNTLTWEVVYDELEEAVE